jgi:hypothetical protein
MTIQALRSRDKMKHDAIERLFRPSNGFNSKNTGI